MAERNNGHVWTYRGRPLRQLEWGLWRDTSRAGYYFLCYRPEGDGGRVVRRWVHVDGVNLTVESVQDRIREIRAGINARKLGAAPALPASDALDHYAADLRRRNLSGEHIDGVLHTCRRFVSDTGITALQQVTVAGVGDWLAGLHDTRPGRGERPLGPRSVNKHRSHLHAWMNWALQRGSISTNPVDQVAPARQTRQLKPFPRPADMRILVDASPPYDAAVWTFLLCTGLRMKSLLSLDLECFRSECITVPHTKRRQEWLIQYDDGCPLWGEDLTELGRRIWDERPPTRDSVAHHLEDACRITGKRFTPHAFRHGFASWLLMMGEGLQDVAAWGHWESTQVVERYYAHLRPRGQSRRDSNRTEAFTIRSHALSKALGTRGTHCAK